jgi:E3 ubiquitin-protein ligase HERC4
VDKWGKVFSWGSDSHGQLGGHNIGQSKIPKMIRGLGTVNVAQVASGDHHGLALTCGGKLFSWGDNTSGQLGLGPNAGAKISVPQPIECLLSLPIRFIACGGNHCILVSNSGAVYAWGQNLKGQLGLGDTENRPYPTQIRSLRNQKITFVACGAEHTVCLTEDGGVFSFGSGQYGQLGHGSKNEEQLPRKVIELMGTEVSQIACGQRHTLALVPTRGRLYAFGLGGSGQLGNSVFTGANTPQVVHGPWIGPTGEPAAPKRVLDSLHEKVKT